MTIPTHSRVLNQDGTFNTFRIGVKKRFFNDIYHSVLKMSVPRFLGILVTIYFGMNFLFATLYFLCGPGAIEGFSDRTEVDRFLSCFFFSVQTMATIGYGKMAPATLSAHLLVTLEAFLGLFGIALATGLQFARFSRPTARVVVSNNALITNHDGKRTIMLRIANERTNQIVEATVSMIFVRTVRTKEGEEFRTIKDLKLVRARSPIFAATWTVMHTIDEESPLYGLDPKLLAENDSEILVSFTGIDDTFNQAVHTRHSYTAQEILFDHKFEDILSWSPSGEAVIDLTKIHATKPI